MDGLGTETKVADGDTTTLLGVILEVGLEKCYKASPLIF